MEEHTLFIDVGCTVTVRLNGVVRSFRIVPGASDLERQEVSAAAPLALAILGHRQGDVCSFTLHPPVTILVTIMHVVCD